MQEQTITALCAALTAQQLPFAQGEPLAPHTTFKIGGPAAFWCTPRDAEQLRRTLQLCRENGVRVYLLGNGSNTLFDDAGFDGAVIDMRGLSGMENSGLDTDAVRITAGAGQTLGRLCSKAQTLGLTGLEFACGIPGTVGGAVYMNAGAYGSELKDVLESVTFLDSDLQLRTLPAADLAMGYRTSIFEQNPDWCILSATVVLHRGDGAAVLARMQELLGKRREKQPLEWPSAGSTFKRPQGAFAGKLIEDCGLRGFTVGGAQISEKHCGFVINRGGATCADVVELTEQVKQIVKQKTGFFCIDNIPVALLPRIVDFALQGENQLNRVAVVMDVRGVRSIEQLKAALDDLDAKKIDYDILFLDANDSVIQRRYKETRRQHPITISEKVPITEAIAKERKL